jgi:hypothetical protein
MATYNITENATNKIVFSYSSNGISSYGNTWDDPLLFTHVLIEDPPPPPAPYRKPMSKWEFRSLFTLEERVACDNAEYSTNIPEEYRAILKTLNKDFDSAQEIDPSLVEVQQGVGLFEQLGLISSGRANQIIYEV